MQQICRMLVKHFLILTLERNFIIYRYIFWYILVKGRIYSHEWSLRHKICNLNVNPHAVATLIIQNWLTWIFRENFLSRFSYKWALKITQTRKDSRISSDRVEVNLSEVEKKALFYAWTLINSAFRQSGHTTFWWYFLHTKLKHLTHRSLVRPVRVGLLPGEAAWSRAQNTHVRRGPGFPHPIIFWGSYCFRPLGPERKD